MSEALTGSSDGVTAEDPVDPLSDDEPDSDADTEVAPSPSPSPSPFTLKPSP